MSSAHFRRSIPGDGTLLRRARNGNSRHEPNTVEDES